MMIRGGKVLFVTFFLLKLFNSKISFKDITFYHIIFCFSGTINSLILFCLVISKKLQHNFKAIHV